jgi:hypothetical protein
MLAPAEELFCADCQRNQIIVAQIAADYLPDEDDPEYARLEADWDRYRAELEGRYPQVCKHCKERVEGQLRNTGYMAKADHLRRIMERSEQKRYIAQTPRQIWTLRFITLAKWTYIASYLVQMLWHVFGYIMAPDERVWDDGEAPIVENFSWDICASQAWWVRSVDEFCVRSPYVTRLVLYAIVADVFTLWWNPRLQDKTNSITGRMRGLRSLWAIRAATLFLRVLSLYLCHNASISRDTITGFHYAHLFMLVFLSISSILAFKTVRISYYTPPRRPVGEHASTSENAGKSTRRNDIPVITPGNAFETMPQGFTTGFEDDGHAPAFPPSPTLTESSYTTHGTEATTPFLNKSKLLDTNAMDWVPTQPKFAKTQPKVYPNPWAKPAPAPPLNSTPYATHSLFATKDPNPFHHPVPAAPKAPAQAQADPWNRGHWAPPVKGTTPVFFNQNHNTAGVGETKGLEGVGVPRNIQRNAELFASPKMKYDFYGTMKETGLEAALEETFNSIFKS